MGFKTMGHCGCPAVFADPFSDADFLDRWVDFIGTWTWDAAGFVYTADADAELYAASDFELDPIAIPEPKRVTVQTKLRVSQGGAFNAQGHLWLGGSERVIAELDAASGATCGVLRILIDDGSIVATNQIELGPVARNEWHTLLLCYYWNSETSVEVAAVLTLNDGRKFRLAIDLNDFGYADLFPSPQFGPASSGVGTRQLGSGTIDFDDYRLMPHQADSGCCCPDCELGCFAATDNFDREALGCCWDLYLGSGSILDWEIDAEELVQSTPGEQVVLYTCSQAPAAFRWAMDLYLPSSGDKAGLVFADVEDSDNGLYYIAELEAGATCGKLRFRLVTRAAGSDSSEDLGEYVVVPGLTAATWHHATLCYNPEHGVLSVQVGDYAHHVKDVPEPAHTPFVGLYVDGSSGFKFDTARLTESQADEFTSASETASNNCPCCFVAGCEAVEGLSLFDDCRLDVLAGTVVGATLGSNATVLIRQSWFGVDPNCTADRTQLVQVTFTAANYSDQVELFLDWIDASTNHSAVLTLNSGPSTDGTLKLYKDGSEIASLDVTALPGGHTLRFCFDQERATVVLNGEELLEEDSTGNGGLLAAVGTRAAGSPITFTSVSSHHHLWEECDDCYVDECVACDDGEMPRYLKVTISGVTGTGGGFTNASYVNGTHLVAVTCGPQLPRVPLNIISGPDGIPLCVGDYVPGCGAFMGDRCYPLTIGGFTQTAGGVLSYRRILAGILGNTDNLLESYLYVAIESQSGGATPEGWGAHFSLLWHTKESGFDTIPCLQISNVTLPLCDSRPDPNPAQDVDWTNAVVKIDAP